MGLVDRLGFEYGPRGRVHRGVASFFATRFGGFVGAKLARLFDRWAFRVTAGGNTAVNLLTGLRPIWLTTTGRKTGRKRRQPLLAFPIEGDLGVIGSNWGQRHHPAWVYNLLADPQATVEYEGVSVPVVARTASPSEEEVIWSRAAEIYPGYGFYRQRAGGREIRLFILAAS